jgi:general secretion pathway protein M
MKAIFMSFWQARVARERVLLSVMGALLALFAAYSVLWTPSAHGIDQLERELPMMRDDFSRIQSMALELNASKANTTQAGLTPDALEPTLRDSLKAAGLLTQKIEHPANGQVVVEFHETSFSTIADWLDQIRQQWKVSLVEGHFERTVHPGQVNARIVLQSGG